jgi:queuine tRNA-ribosyltransferase
MKQHAVVVTRGGAHAMLDRATGEVMHPVVGPLVEAQRLYVAPSRLAERLSVHEPEPLVLLDAGLGAGSNAIAAWSAAQALPAHARALEIVSIDRTRAALELALQPEHAAAFGFVGEAAPAAHALLTEQRHESARTRWRLRLGELLSELAQEPAASVDVVFWDPFSPRADPGLWSVGAFAALRRVCRAGATVHTYSGATATRSALLLASFAVGYGVAAGDKQKHTTVAALRFEDLSEPLDVRWLERVRRSAAAWPADAPSDALARLESSPQFARADATP